MVLVTILTLIAAPIILLLFNELIGYLKVLNYRKQGIKNAKYVPLLLFMKKMMDGYQSDDVLKFRKDEMVDLDPNQPFFVMSAGRRCQLYLHSNEAAKEFYAKEIQVTEKVNYMPQVDFLGFFFKNGQEVQDKRAIFAKIFHYSNVVSMLPGIRETVRKHVRLLKERVVEAGGELKVHLKKEFSAQLFDDLSGEILFKGSSNKLTERFEGLTVPQLTQKMFKKYVDGCYNFLNRLPFVAALGLNKEAKELQRLQRGLREIVKNEYKRRYNNSNLDDTCVLDIMIGINKEFEKETGKPKFTMEEIASTFEMFQFAASDTSFHLSSSCICYLAKEENQKYQERLGKELQSTFEANLHYWSEDLSSVKELDLVFRETGRLSNSAPVLLERIAMKDFELCGCKVNKGDKIEQILINYQPEYYKDPSKFNPDRFDSESPEYNKAPHLRRSMFSHGKRSCIGRYLGEMMVKLVVGEFLKELEVSTEKGYEIKFGYDPAYGVKNPDLILKVRESS